MARRKNPSQRGLPALGLAVAAVVCLGSMGAKTDTTEQNTPTTQPTIVTIETSSPTTAATETTLSTAETVIQTAVPTTAATEAAVPTTAAMAASEPDTAPATSSTPAIVVPAAPTSTVPSAPISTASPESTEPTPAQYDYVLNTNTKKFHHPKCSSVGDILPENRTDFHGTYDQVIAKGYKPCKRCFK